MNNQLVECFELHEDQNVVASIFCKKKKNGETPSHVWRQLPLSIGLFSCTCAAPKNDCDVKKLDACSADLFVFATSAKVPATPAELKPFCATQLKSVECSRDYLKRCTESVVQGIGSIFLDDINAEIEGRCDESSDYHKGDKYNDLEACMHKSLDGQCSAEVRKFAEGLLEKYAGELLGTVCSAYRTGDKCKGIPFDSTPGDKNIRAVLTPLIKVASALG
ncbi:hypothetical protein V5799_014416 [Amblyomma americanum]|uniref:Uncharacterized protein n=1 Tax=Amblyomma americanum TaxID=6943 RepID=A0AAQ4E337_AMBAM